MHLGIGLLIILLNLPAIYHESSRALNDTSTGEITEKSEVYSLGMVLLEAWLATKVTGKGGNIVISAGKDDDIMKYIMIYHGIWQDNEYLTRYSWGQTYKKMWKTGTPMSFFRKWSTFMAFMVGFPIYRNVYWRVYRIPQF